MAARSGVYARAPSTAFTASTTAAAAPCTASPRTHAIRHHITSTSLLSQLEVEPLGVYCSCRIRWAGHGADHVSRMPMSRAPRKLLTGWVAHTRPVGYMTCGRTLKKALVGSLVGTDIPTAYTKWRELAV
jgi:hypothetical protein